MSDNVDGLRVILFGSLLLLYDERAVSNADAC